MSTLRQALFDLRDIVRYFWDDDNSLIGDLDKACQAADAALAQPEPVAFEKEPSPGLLMSMAIRFDHGLGCPGYYDSELTGTPGVTHAMQLQSTLSQMRQLYEEVSGHGFYRPEFEAEYALAAAPAISLPPAEKPTSGQIYAALVNVFGKPFAEDPVLLQRIADAIKSEISLPPAAERDEPTDFQLEQLFAAVHSCGEFGRDFREYARQILAQSPAAEKDHRSSSPEHSDLISQKAVSTLQAEPDDAWFRRVAVLARVWPAGDEAGVPRAMLEPIKVYHRAMVEAGACWYCGGKAGEGCQKPFDDVPCRRAPLQAEQPAMGAALPELVTRFLSWPLPDTVCADACASDPKSLHRSGTNLLTATEAEKMLRHVLGIKEGEL